MKPEIKRLREIMRAAGQALDKVEDNVDDYIDAGAEIERLIKTEYKHFQKRKELRVREFMAGEEEKDTTRYRLTYLPTKRRVLNEDELETIIPDADMRDLLYIKKPKSIKEIEEICAENAIKQADLFVNKEGSMSLKVKEI